MTTLAYPIPYIVGAFQHVLDPPGQREAQEAHPGQQWYINDHCFVAGPDGRLHWFGITNPYAEVGHYYDPGSHRHLGHASAPGPWGPWTEHPHVVALPEDTKEHNVGASFALRRGEEYYLYYVFPDKSIDPIHDNGLTLATSRDLFHWERQEWASPDLGKGMRDPCVVELDDGTYLLYICAGHGPVGAVTLAESADLREWRVLPPALVSDMEGDWGPLESPFVHRHGDLFYLFLNHSHRQYEETLVFVSEDPRHFDWEKPLTTIFCHATEVFTWEGKTYLSHCGLEDRQMGWVGGLWLAELGWATEVESG
jgi:hypothetical protein